MFKKILTTIFCLSITAVVFADELKIKKDAPKTYVVQRGDTLWDISEIFLNKPWLWPNLWRLNPTINNPHLIFPGDKLRLVYDDEGKPLLVKGKPEIKWSPKIRKTMKDANPISMLPLEILAPYLNYSNVLSDSVLNDSSYILGGDSGANLNVEGAKIYVNGVVEPARNYAIYRKGEAVIDPISEDVLGYYAILVGTAQAIKAGDLDQNTPATLVLDNSKREVKAGDIILPANQEQKLPALYYMKNAVDTNIKAQMISNYNNVREFGKFEVVLLNKGSNDGLDVGHVLAVVRKGANVIDNGIAPVFEEDASSWSKSLSLSNKKSLPNEKIGHLFVFKVQHNISLGIILSSKKPINIKDIVTAP